jgi:CDP-diacylglycerol--glycerol-3-phosphate 3-phosphatidyltransferase
MATVTPAPKRPPIVNLPNVLTASRFVLAMVLFVLIAWHESIGPTTWLWCLGVFAAAAVTDYFDGYYARKLGLTSTLGRNLDPLVDKVLMCGAFTFLLEIPQASAVGLQAWMVVVVVARELIITSLRGFLESQGIRFGADLLGKIKMWLQCAALVAVFVTLYDYAQGDWRTALCPWFIYAMVAATALSGAQYLWKATLLLKAE